MINTLTYREALRAFADGKTLEMEYCGEWHKVSIICQVSTTRLDSPSHYRIRQAKITINGVEVPEPLRSPPKFGENYFVPETSCEGFFSVNFQWDDDENDTCYLKRGLVHLTPEAAESHARALILASGGQV